MNKYILCVLDRGNKTLEELEENSADADAIYDADADACAANAAYYAYWAAYCDEKSGKHILIAMDRDSHSAEELGDDAVEAAHAAHAAYYAAETAYSDDDVEYWLNKYFEITGEDKEEYERALKEKQ